MSLPLDRVLRLRPSNAVARFGGRSRLPVLDPRDLLSGLFANSASPGGALLSIRVPVREAIPGLLRAARELDAPLGLTCAHPAADRQTALLFTETVSAAAAEVDHGRPLFLEAGPIQVTKLEGLDSVAASIHRCLEAGFTLVSVEIGTLELEQALAAVTEVAAPLQETSVSLEIDVPPGVELPVWLEALRQRRCNPAFVRIGAHVVRALLQEGPDYLARAIATYASQAESFGAFLSADDPEVALPGGPSVLVAAGVRKLRVGQLFARPVLRTLAPEVREGLAARARSLQLTLEELLLLIGERLPAFEPAARNRIEALCFAEAVDLLGGIGLRGAGRRIVDSLAGKQE